MSTDAYPGRQMDDSPVGEKGLQGGLPHVEVGSWTGVEDDPALEEAIRALRVQRMREKLYQNELERQALRQDLENQVNAPLAGSRSGVEVPLPQPPPVKVESHPICPPPWPQGLTEGIAVSRAGNRPPPPPRPRFEGLPKLAQLDADLPSPPRCPSSGSSSWGSSCSNKSKAPEVKGKKKQASEGNAKKLEIEESKDLALL